MFQVGSRLIICERSGDWAAALRSELANTEVRIVETRWLARCEEEVFLSPGAVIGLELAEGNCVELPRELVRLRRRWPQSSIFVFATEAWRDWEWLLREAGAEQFVASPRRLAPVVELIQRHAIRQPPSLASITTRILAELPWGEPV